MDVDSVAQSAVQHAQLVGRVCEQLPRDLKVEFGAGERTDEDTVRLARTVSVIVCEAERVRIEMLAEQMARMFAAEGRAGVVARTVMRTGELVAHVGDVIYRFGRRLAGLGEGW